MHRSLAEWQDSIFISAFIIIITLEKFYLHLEKYWAQHHSVPPPSSKKKKFTNTLIAKLQILDSGNDIKKIK